MIIFAAAGIFARAMQNLTKGTEMNNLDDLKEQLQEDIMCYIDVNQALFHPEKVDTITSDLCQIAVDLVNELKKENQKWTYGNN